MFTKTERPINSISLRKIFARNEPLLRKRAEDVLFFTSFRWKADYEFRGFCRYKHDGKVRAMVFEK